MGSNSSKQAKSDRSGRRSRKRQQTQQHGPVIGNISPPSNGPVMVPPVYRDETGRPIEHAAHELDAETITQALHIMSEYLAKRSVTISAITVGGAVNTLYLRSRQSTHDVDFFLGNAESSQHHIIHEAARHANRQLRGRLGVDWFNNSTQVMMRKHIQQSLAEAAVQQNAKVFDHVINHAGGLRMYAAPWSYAFCGKLNRLCEETVKPYDLADAVVYLREHLRISGERSINAAAIYHWCETYGKKATATVLQQVDEAFHAQYDVRVIKWQ